MRLSDYLLNLVACWCAATGRSEVALGGQAVRDGKFVGRLVSGTQPRLATFERMLAFFRDGKNWPGNVIPSAAAELLERLDNIATDAAASPGNGDEFSPDHGTAAARADAA